MIDEIINGLSLEDLVGQLLCYDIYDKDYPEEVEKIISKIKPGGIFVTGMSGAKIKMYTDMVNKYAKVPVIVASDIENGPETAIKNTGYLPQPMAWGACDDEKLIEKAGKIVGSICRENGVHWTYSPVVDINYNFRSPECNIRAISDDPKKVTKIAGAMVRGLEYNDNMVACVKHFPGQGIDDRNSHFLTTVSSLSKEKWMSTYGYVYKEFIKSGISSIMMGHCALPCVQTEFDECGPLPAVLSHSIMTDFLKGELGFDGCIVSDAMSMVGVSAMVKDLKQLAIQFINAGGDMILFPEPTDFDMLLNAVKSGKIAKERLFDAVKRVLKLKEKVKLLKGQTHTLDKCYSKDDLSVVSQEIANKSIKIIRDYNKILPLKVPAKSKILMINVLEPHFHKLPSGDEFDTMKMELELMGYTVDCMTNPKHKVLQERIGEYSAVLMNCKMSSKDYHGGSLRICWNNIMVMWRGYVLQHPKFIFTSFGDPYKLYDMPYLKEYINAFSFTEESQRAAVNVIFGKIKPTAKNPVEFKGFFEREV